MAKILVVDDSVSNVKMIEVNLKKQGWEVIAAYDGNEVLEKTISEKPDVITLDINMPKFSGLKVIKTLRENPTTATIPIIVVSAMAGDETIQQMYGSRVQEWLPKPFEPSNLVDLVRKYVSDDVPVQSA